MGNRFEIEHIVYSGHAVRQMFARQITVDEIKVVIDEGQVIASYMDDNPYPSQLLLGNPSDRPIHVVLAYNDQTKTGYVVTTYIPDIKHWNEDFKTRKKS